MDDFNPHQTPHLGTAQCGRGALNQFSSCLHTFIQTMDIRMRNRIAFREKSGQLWEKAKEWLWRQQVVNTIQTHWTSLLTISDGFWGSIGKMAMWVCRMQCYCTLEDTLQYAHVCMYVCTNTIGYTPLNYHMQQILYIHTYIPATIPLLPAHTKSKQMHFRDRIKSLLHLQFPGLNYEIWENRLLQPEQPHLLLWRWEKWQSKGSKKKTKNN